MKRIMSLIMVVSVIVSCFSITAFAGNLNNCKWNTNYKYVTSSGTAYGTNTFYIYGNLGKNKVQIQNAAASTVVKVNDAQKEAMYDVAKFKVEIYKGSKFLNSYTVKLNGTFYVPAGLGTKYTVKIKFIPPANQSSLYKAACKANDWYYLYKLVDIKG